MTDDAPTHVVKFQRGRVVGARSLRMEYVTADSDKAALAAAKKLFPTWKQDGYFVLGVVPY
jgi:hypothetical protein